MYSRILGKDTSFVTEEMKEVNNFMVANKFRFEHPRRDWEYGLCLKLVKELRPERVLNVGGGNSPLSSMIADLGVFVAELDPLKPSNVDHSISYIIDEFPTKLFTSEKFDLVVSTSVIEHVKDDKNFFEGLLKLSKDYVFITTDFHPNGTAVSAAHERTYNEKMLLEMVALANAKGLEMDGKADYTYGGNFVYDYTFASLAVRRV